MVSPLRRARISARNDPHDWNSWDNYQIVHEVGLSQHPFVVDFRDTLRFGFYAHQRGLRLDGFIQCQNSVILEVTNRFETAYDRAGRMYARCYRFRYIGRIPGGNLLLKYHNLHRNRDIYIHRVYDPTTGAEEFNETLQRYQFPTFSEVLDELEYLAQTL